MERDARMPILLFHTIHRAHHNALQAELVARGLEGLGSPLLMMLLQSRGKDGTLPAQRELADALHVTPAAVAMSLNSLERLGYVARQTDPGDRRRKQVAVTERGAAAVETCWAIFREIDRQMLKGFTEDERECLDNYHRRMLRNLFGNAFDETENPFERKECQCSKP